jgi:hypothetical protein
MASSKSPTFDWAFWFQWLMATSLGWVLGRFLLPNLAFVIIGVALGVLQWITLQQRLRHAWRWIVATAVGWSLGSGIILFFMPNVMDFIAGVVIGITTGTAQWLILRREFYWAGWWIVINVVAWTTGLALLPGILLTGVVAGFVTGTAIALLSQNPKPATSS